MPYSLYQALGLGELKPITMELMLADCSIRHPRGVVEDMLVHIGKLMIHADFVVLEMESDSSKG